VDFEQAVAAAANPRNLGYYDCVNRARVIGAQREHPPLFV